MANSKQRKFTWCTVHLWTTVSPNTTGTEHLPLWSLTWSLWRGGKSMESHCVNQNCLWLMKSLLLCSTNFNLSLSIHFRPLSETRELNGPSDWSNVITFFFPSFFWLRRHFDIVEPIMYMNSQQDCERCLSLNYFQPLLQGGNDCQIR